MIDDQTGADARADRHVEKRAKPTPGAQMASPRAAARTSASTTVSSPVARCVVSRPRRTFPADGGIAEHVAGGTHELGHADTKTCRRDAKLPRFLSKRTHKFDDVGQHGFAAAIGARWLQSPGENATLWKRHNAGGALGAADVDANCV